MKTVSIGSGTRNGSPYISVIGNSTRSPSPAAIGWLRLITQMRSRSPASRHFRLQGVPIRRLKIFEKCPEWRTISPIPSQTCRCTRSTTCVGDLAMRRVTPPEEHVGLGEPRVGQAVLGLLQRRGLA